MVVSVSELLVAVTVVVVSVVVVVVDVVVVTDVAVDVADVLVNVAEVAVAVVVNPGRTTISKVQLPLLLLGSVAVAITETVTGCPPTCSALLFAGL